MIPQPSTYEGSKNGSVFATVGDVWWTYSIRPYGWVRVILRNTDAIPQPGTCGPSKNCPVFVHFGAVYEAYSIRPYNRVRAILRNIDAIFQLNTCDSSKNCPVFVPFGAVWWGVCNTPLQSGTCDPSKYRCNSPTGYMRGFKKWICIRHRRWRMVRRMQYAPTTGYVRPFKNCPVFVPFGAVGWAYAIRPYNRVCAILRNTDAIPQPDTCDSTKYRCDLSTGGARIFGRWGGGGYRLRGRRA